MSNAFNVCAIGTNELRPPSPSRKTLSHRVSLGGRLRLRPGMSLVSSFSLRVGDGSLYLQKGWVQHEWLRISSLMAGKGSANLQKQMPQPLSS